MRRSFPRTLTVVLMIFLPVFSVFINGQDQSSKNPTVAETELLTTDEGPAARVTEPLQRGSGFRVFGPLSLPIRKLRKDPASE